MATDRMMGSVTRLLLNRGFGFIRGTDGYVYFMHVKDVVPMRAFDLMREGQQVSFMPATSAEGNAPAKFGSDKGNDLRAIEVRVETH